MANGNGTIEKNLPPKWLALYKVFVHVGLPTCLLVFVLWIQYTHKKENGFSGEACDRMVREIKVELEVNRDKIERVNRASWANQRELIKINERLYALQQKVASLEQENKALRGLLEKSAWLPFLFHGKEKREPAGPREKK